MKKLLYPSLFLCVLWLIFGVFLQKNYGDAPMGGHWNKRWWNNEASAHFLNSLGRYHQRPLSEHWFAISAPCTEPPEKPCVKNGNANIKGSAVVSSERLAGEDVYTSFPPGSMIIASMFVLNISEILNIDSITAMRGFNWFLCLAAAFLFLFTLGKLSYIPPKKGAWLAGMATLPLLVSVEALHSHHLSLWAHQVFQPILALVLLASSSPLTTRRSIIIGLLCSIACWVEWTGFLLSAGLSVFIFALSPSPDKIKNFIFFSLSSMLGPIALLVYYDQLIGLNPYLNSLMVRFSSRTVVDYYSWKDWLDSVMQSYGSWATAVTPMIIFGLFASFKKPLPEARQACVEFKKKQMYAQLAVLGFILTENLLMFEHSIVYTFDRLKISFAFGFLIMIFGSFILIKYPRRGAYFVAISVLTGVCLSIYQFAEIYPPFWK